MADSSTSRRSTVETGDFDTLYAMIKGARYASGVMDAKTAFERGQFANAAKLLKAVKERHELSHFQTEKTIAELEKSKAKDADDRARRLRKKVEQNELAFAEFDLMLSRLSRQAVEEEESEDDAPSETDEVDGVLSESAKLPLVEGITEVDLKSFLNKFEAASTTASQVAVITKSFELLKVATEADILPLTMYAYQGGAGELNLIVTSAAPIGDEVKVRLADGQPIKPVKRSRLARWGVKGKLARLTVKSKGDGAASEDSADSEDLLGKGMDSHSPSASSHASEGFTDEARDKILDMGAFSQLVDAAQRSGLVADSDAIAHLRDREFRTGDYAEAFQRMESIFGKFNAAASQRDQRLRREEMDIKSGRLKMSPKEIQAKRTRDTAETQQISRARSRFMRVLEGLRVLMRSSDGDER